MSEVIIGLAGIIVLAATFSLLGKIIKQPPIVAYLLTGLFIGALGASKFVDIAIFDIASELGIILLLFLAGLEIKIEKIKRALKPILFIGVGQIVVMMLVFFYSLIWSI